MRKIILSLTLCSLISLLCSANPFPLSILSPYGSTVAALLQNTLPCVLPKGWPLKLAYIPGTKIIPECTTKIKIAFINDRIGHGVIATEFIAKGSVIGEYTGDQTILFHEDIAKKTYVISLAAYDIDSKRFDFTTIESAWQLVVDAQNAGNETRFINHSNNPNVTAFKDSTVDISKVFYQATKDIHPGQELTTNYGDAYWAGKVITPQ